MQQSFEWKPSCCKISSIKILIALETGISVYILDTSKEINLEGAGKFFCSFKASSLEFCMMYVGKPLIEVFDQPVTRAGKRRMYALQDAPCRV